MQVACAQSLTVALLAPVLFPNLGGAGCETAAVAGEESED
jgi:hypothetical protein